ncbi:MAG: hypothetical protein HYX94_04815 [Chloroflexi bacterium]|nr:hypothetical protein [Chloroflexota bacterium]
MQVISDTATAIDGDSKAGAERFGRQGLVLVLACGMAGTLAALALSRFYFLGYGMAAPALAGALVGMLALSYLPAVSAGVMASSLSLLLLGIDHFYDLYDLSPDPGVTVLLAGFWILSGGAGALVGALAFRRWGPKATIALLSLVLTMFLVTIHSESSFMTVQAASEPAAKSYGVDGILYLKTFYLMKQGEDFYGAFREAVRQDLRVDLPGVPDHPAQYFNYRLPTLHQLWVWLLPAKGNYIPSLVILLQIVALVCSFLIVHKWTGSPLALLAPILLAPHYALFASGWYFDFSELWAALLLVIASLLFVSRKWVYSVALVTLVLTIRELFLFAPFAGALASFLAGRRRHLPMWLVPVAAFLALEVSQYWQVAPYLSVTDERTWTTWQAGGGLSFAFDTLRFAALGITTKDLIVVLLLALAVAGLFRVPSREHRAFFGVLLLAPIASFLFIGHGGEIGDAYW